MQDDQVKIMNGTWKVSKGTEKDENILDKRNPCTKLIRESVHN